MKRTKLLFVFSLLMAISSIFALPKLVGTFAQAGFTDWDTANESLNMTSLNDTLYAETLTLPTGTYAYKVLDGTAWTDPNYPGNNQSIVVDASTTVTWICNNVAQLVMHKAPIVAGDFLSQIGGTNWDPTDVHGQMTLLDGSFYVYQWQGVIPAGTYQFKITLNGNWDQNPTSANIPFVSDGTIPTLITYNFNTNTITTSAGTPPSATVTFTVNDVAGQTHTAFYLKGSWNANGNYDMNWDNGTEHATLVDDGTNGDAVAGDHIFTCTQDLVTDGGSNTWAWGVNDETHTWVDTTYPTFSLTTTDPQTVSVTLAGGTTQDVTVTFQVTLASVDPAIYAGGVSVQGDVLPLDWTNGSHMLSLAGDHYSVDITFPTGSVKVVHYKYGAFDASSTWTWEAYMGNRTFTINDSFATQVLPVDDFTATANHDQTASANTLILKNQPNPFHGETMIEYSVAKRSNVQIQIFNIKGQLVRILVNEDKGDGTYKIRWDGKDDAGKKSPSGVYLYKLRNGGVLIGKKMVLLK
ncbi:MAG TPA: FlgD immunoglobulin-like domain containing protein [Candidatus Cloacimonadota bacterium]|nr:FlgD immunoglobulin-like domain containing protein [Candidatus Cloacimonadota bacterium]